MELWKKEKPVFPASHGDALHSRCICWPQDDASPELRRKILELEETAWPGHLEEPWPEPEHIASFCLLEGGALAAHAAVVAKRFSHQGETYLACGLAEVVTHPDCRGKGFALELVRRAAAFIRAQEADLCVFTCKPELAAFYRRGGWEVRPDLRLIGGSREKPFPSDGEGLCVLFRLLSEKALAHAEDFRETDLFLGLGEGRLW